MASIPRKGVKGISLRKWVIDTLNGVIDYLHSARVRPGNGILIRETPSGTIIELKKQPDSPQSSGGGGGGTAQDISATVSGGTATIAISGSTSTVEIVGGTSGNVTISGNTNGQVVIDATGGGGGGVGSYDVFPDYNSNPVNISGGTVYTADGNVWLIGTVGIYKKSSSTETPSVTLMIYSEGTLIRTRDVFIDQGVYSSLSTWNVNTNFVVPISIPIPSGFQFEVTKSDSAQFNISMYSCITAPPLNRTVTTTSGTGNGSLFRALSDDGDANISFDQSLDGQPIDFEGASVL